MGLFLPDFGCQSSSLKVIDESSVIVHCEKMSEGDGMSPRSESKSRQMEVIISNILHLGVIALEDEFQRGERWGEEKEATVICTGFTNLLNRI